MIHIQNLFDCKTNIQDMTNLPVYCNIFQTSRFNNFLWISSLCSFGWKFCHCKKKYNVQEILWAIPAKNTSPHKHRINLIVELFTMKTCGINYLAINMVIHLFSMSIIKTLWTVQETYLQGVCEQTDSQMGRQIGWFIIVPLMTKWIPHSW